MQCHKLFSFYQILPHEAGVSYLISQIFLALVLLEQLCLFPFYVINITKKEAYFPPYTKEYNYLIRGNILRGHYDIYL